MLKKVDKRFFNDYNIGVKDKNFTPFCFMEKNFYYTELFEIYKSLLTEKQKEVFEMHFLLDFSLSEISEEKGISRQNVNDAIKSAKRKLDELESTLKLKQKHDALKELEKNVKDDKTADEIKRIINI